MKERERESQKDREGDTHTHTHTPTHPHTDTESENQKDIKMYRGQQKGLSPIKQFNQKKYSLANCNKMLRKGI